MATQVKFAELNDIQGMLQVLNSNLISNFPDKTKSELEENGFLINPFTYHDIENHISDDHCIILVAKSDVEIVGYVIEYQVTAEEFEWLIDGDIPIEFQNKFHDEKTLYHRHIGTHSSHKGVGAQLMQSLIDLATQKEYKNVICQIALEPFRNKKSIVFHEKFGFQMIGKSLDQKTNTTFGLFWKKLN